MVNTILKEADLFCPNSVRINFTIYHKNCMRVIGERKSGFITILATFSYILAACFAESLLTNATCVIFGLLLGYYLNVNLDTRHGVVKHNE